MKTEDGFGFLRLLTICSEYFGLNRFLSSVVVCLTGLLIGFAIFWFIHSAPPREITITSGPAGSAFETNAVRYAEILARNGVTLKILPSQGSFENLDRLEDPSAQVDIGFVQGGIANGTNAQNLLSLGSLAYEPLLVFYRGTNSIGLLSQFAGHRLAVGPVGSGTRALALALLRTNGITDGGATTLLPLDADAAAAALMAGTIDAAFMMSDSASMQTMRSLLRAPNIQLMSFEQADAYARRFNYLNRLRLPEGAIDLGRNLPAHDLSLIGPTVELLARRDLNPALSDLLLEAAREINGRAGIFQNQGEFPAPLVHEYTLSPDALRYYKSGKTFLYRNLPFWLASLANRVLVAFVPMVIVLVPGLRLVPILYRWKSQLRIYRWYRKLVVLERELTLDWNPERRQEMTARLDEIETVVKQMRLPASFAYQFYMLRGHIDYVRAKLTARARE
jgi:hypothetical protein